MAIRQLAQVLARSALAALGLCLAACSTTPPAPSLLSLEVPISGGGFAGRQPEVAATASSAANYFVLPLASTTAPIVRAVLSSPYPSDLKLTVLDVTRNTPADLPQLPGGSAMPSTGAFQVRSVTATNPATWNIVIRYPDSFQGSKSIRTFIADSVQGVTSAPLVYNMSFRGSRLTVSIASANGDGKASSTPAGIDCPPACGADFLGSTSVFLTQSVLHNQTQFTGWTGNCTGSGNSCTVSLVSPVTPGIPVNASVTANFRIHSNTAIPATMSCPAAPLISGKHWVTQPNCGQVLFTTLQCDAQGYFCCGAQNGTPSPRCSGQNLTTVTCSTSPIAGGPVDQQLIQPGGCYVAD